MNLSDLTAKRGGGGGGGGRGKSRGALASRRPTRQAMHQSSILARPGGDAGSRNRVYVHNLAFEVTWQDLKDHMKTAGAVTRADLITRADGSSKGCGLVEFATARDAANAIRTLNDSVLRGRPILVREDREAAGGGVASAGGASAGVRSPAFKGGNRRLYVGNLPFRVTWEELKDSFRKFGEVAYANVMTHPDGRSKGWALVEMGSVKDAHNAIAGTIVFDGRALEVREDREDRAGPAAGYSAPAKAAYASGAGFSSVNNRVYVGNLSWDVQWQDLKDLFKTAGEVVRADVMTGSDGRSRGCGLVEFTTPEAAAHAIATLNDAELKGRLIFVREDREAGDAAGGRAPASRGAGASGTRVYVGNIPFNLTWQQLKDDFGGVAKVVRADIEMHPDGRSKGFALVTFETAEGAAKAIEEFRGASMDGRLIEVRLDRD